MSNQPLVSILVPIYNVERYLRECLESIVAQTLDDIEIICIDDGSTDGSLAIVKEYQAQDNRIVLITKPNAGYGDTMNRGLEVAQGKYIGIVESDDIAQHNMFEKLSELAEHNNLDVVKSNFYTHATHTAPDEDPVLDNLAFCPEGVVFTPLDKQEIFLTQPAIWSALYKRDFLEQNNIRFLETPGASFQDTSFNYRVFALAKRVMVTHEAFLHYRIDNASSSVKSQAKIFCICDEYAEMWQFTGEQPEIFAALGKRLPQIQFGGYRWNLERLTPALQPAFYDRFVEAFLKIKEANLLDRNYFDENAWDYLSHMIADPAKFFYETYGPRDVETSYVVRLLSMTDADKRKCLKALLGTIGTQDEVIVVDTFNGVDVDPEFVELSHQDSRLFSDIDLWECASCQQIDQERIRGNKFVALVCEGRVSSSLWERASHQNIGTHETVQTSKKRDGHFAYASYSTAELSNSSFLLFPLLVYGVSSFDPSEESSVLSARVKGIGSIFQKRLKSAESHITLADYCAVEANFKECIGTVFDNEKLIEGSLVTEAPATLSLLEWYRGVIGPLWNNLRGSYQLLSYSDRVKCSTKPHSGEYPALTLAPGRAYGMKSVESNACDTPDITVIIPVYNCEEYVLTCLESVLCQEGVSIQVICIDDGSSDASLSILNLIAEIDDRLSVYCELNGGAGAARNRGIELARGKYLAFIDPDDYYPESLTLSKLYSAAMQNNAKMSGGSFISFLPSGEVKRAYYGNEAPYTIKQESYRTFEQDQFDYGWIRFIYERTLFDEGGLRFHDYRWFEDPVFFVDAMTLVDRYYVIPDAVYCYREDYKEVQWSAEKIRDMLAGISHNLDFAKEHDFNKLYERLIRRINYDYCAAILEHLEDKEVLARMAAIQGSFDISRVAYLVEWGYEAFILSPLYYRICEEQRTAVVRVAKKIEGSQLYKTMQSYYEKIRNR